MSFGSNMTKGVFYGFSVFCLLVGIGFFILCVLAWRFGWHDIGILPFGTANNVHTLLFGTAMLFGGVANASALFVLHRMQSAGCSVGVWRTCKDFRLYSEYWRIAPEKGWSRVPLVAFAVSFILAGCFLFSLMYLGVPSK